MWSFFLRVTLSGLLAGLIGLERELRSKDAGLKTHFLVGIGSALIMIVSKYGFFDVIGMKGIALDPSRVAAQVVCGISFLGAGTIIFEKHYIRGLTTAAGIWATSGIGLAVGAGMYSIGIFSTVLVLCGQEILNRIFKNSIFKYFDISIWTNYSALTEIQKIIDQHNFTVIQIKFKKDTLPDSKDVSLLEIRLKSSGKNDPNDLISQLYEDKAILKIEAGNFQ